MEYVLKLAEWIQKNLPEVVDDHLFNIEKAVRTKIDQKSLCLVSLMGQSHLDSDHHAIEGPEVVPDDESGNGSGSHNRHLPSMGVEMTESMTIEPPPSSLMQFNQDVESMLQHGAMRQAMNNSSSKETSEGPETEASSSSMEEPREDFTQHRNNFL